MGRALTSSSAPRTSHKMRTRPARSLCTLLAKDSGMSLTILRWPPGPRADASCERHRTANGTFVLRRSGRPERLFGLEGPLHNGADGVAGRPLRPQDRLYLPGDGHFHICRPGKIDQSIRCANALRYHPHPGENFRQRPSLSKFDADVAVPAQRARASQNQVAEARKSAESLRLGAELDSKAGHFGEAARDQRRERIRAQPDSVTGAGGNGDHVLHRAGELNAKHIVVRIEAECLSGNLLLELTRQFLIV